VTSRDKLKGAVIGGVTGAVLGGVLGNNVDISKR
jgi:outer membrane lipoprotein SlyB